MIDKLALLIVLLFSLVLFFVFEQRLGSDDIKIFWRVPMLGIEDVKIILSMTGIDVFSTMLIAVEIVNVKRFATPWKLISYAGLAPSTRESSGKTKIGGKITKQGSPWLRWILVQCAMTALRYDQHLTTFYERLTSKKESANAIVAAAKGILVIIWYMLTRRELYRHMNKERYEQKLSRIRKIKESAV